jgi:dTDP-4-dehydrorhamnose 3,5-epimerase
MATEPATIPGVIVLEPTVHGDERGFFIETYRESALAERGIRERWVQDNHARSGRGVLRGMHFSVDPGQAKLVRCARGRVLDVVVDLRAGSPTFGRWQGVELDDERVASVYVPTGLAHGYLVLSEIADVVYKCSEYYDPAKERSIAWDDPEVGIAWPEGEKLVSERDAAALRLATVAADLPFIYSG